MPMPDLGRFPPTCRAPSRPCYPPYPAEPPVTMSDAPLLDLTIPTSKKRAQSESYLLSKHNVLKVFDSVEDLATDEQTPTEKDRDAVLHHLLQFRSAVARVFRKAGLYTGNSIFDDFVLEVTKSGQPYICGRVIDRLPQAGVERPGSCSIQSPSSGWRSRSSGPSSISGTLQCSEKPISR